MVLCEQDDLAGATSPASKELVHGGLRYLEYYEFRLVREALIELTETNGFYLRGLTVEGATLEDVFIRLTGRRIRT